MDQKLTLRLAAIAAAVMAALFVAAGFISYNADSNYNQKIFDVLDAYAYANPMPEEEIAALDALLARYRPNPISYVRIAHKATPSNTVYSYRAHPIAVSEASITSSTRPWRLEFGRRYSSSMITHRFQKIALVFLAVSAVCWGRYFYIKKRKRLPQAGAVNGY